MLLPLLLFAALQAPTPVRVTSPLVERMLQRAVPPVPGEVGLAVLVSADSLRVGEQLDIITLAWFPRDLLTRLARPPVIRPPSIPGVFAAIQPTSPEVAGSRQVGDVRYDVYVAHHVVFPLDEGELRIPPASLRYSLPAGRDGRLSEEPVDRAAVARPVRILPLPPGGPGPVVTRLVLRWTMAPVVPRVGEPVPLELRVEGRGNLALWPAPTLRFPEGTRGYPGAEETISNVREGRYGGTRVWRFSLVVDSAGTVVVPDVSYPHFDPDRSVWRDASAKGPVIPVLPAAIGATTRAPVAILSTPPLGVWDWSRGVIVALVALFGGPVLVLGLQREVRMRRARVPGASLRPSEDLVRRVQTLVPEPGRRHGDQLVAALREAGLSREDSANAAALYAEASSQRFAPEASQGMPDLEQRATRLLASWPRRLGTLGVTALMLLAGTPAPGTAAEGPVELSRRAGAAWGVGQEAEAAAAWVVARRLAPRSATLHQGWAQVAGRSADLVRVGRVSPLTPVEWALASGIGWALACLAWGTGKRRGAVAFLMLAIVGAGASVALAWWYARPAAVVARAVSARQAPHGLAAEQGQLDPLAVVTVRDVRPGWVRIHHPRTGEGWVPAHAVVSISGPTRASFPEPVR